MSKDPRPLPAELRAIVAPHLHGASAYAVPNPGAIRVKLDANESPYRLDAEGVAELTRVLAAVPLNRYPDPSCGALRSHLARELDLEPAQLLFGNGSDELIQLLCLALSGRREPAMGPATVLYPTPTFSVFKMAAQSAGMMVVEVPLQKDFTIDPAVLRAQVASSLPNLVFFARPNNPTGTLWPSAVVRELARDYPQTVFVSDEAYGGYADDGMAADVADLPNLLVMRTLSKIGLAGVRVGYLFGHPALVTEINKVRTPYNISALNQAAALWMLEHRKEALLAQCRLVVAERQRVADALSRDATLEVFDSKANLILVRAAPGQGQRLWSELCARGILVRYFGAEGPLADCLRVTIGGAPENDAFLTALAEC